MGWLYACDPREGRAELVAKFRRPGFWSEGVVVLADRVVGNHYWAAIESRGRRCVALVLMQGGGRGEGWGYKVMDEHAGPYVVDCPLALLDMTDEPTEGHAVGWRQKVRGYHAARRAKRARARDLEAGALVGLGGKYYRLHSPAGPRRGWYVSFVGGGGTLYRMTAAQLARAETATQDGVERCE
jgi:hypothetical protein